MTNLSTADTGINIATCKIEKHGGVDVIVHKEGNRKFITFKGLNNKTYKVTTRTKRSGTWQTTITYGNPCKENAFENEFWLFIDLSTKTPRFYPVPLWWISNDIYQAHQKYLKQHDGHRPSNDNSNHHGIQLRRIEKWKDKWEILGLS
jgi:hypothetical protein